MVNEINGKYFVLNICSFKPHLLEKLFCSIRRQWLQKRERNELNKQIPYTGRQSKEMPYEHQVLMVLYFVRNNPRYRLVCEKFDISKGTVSSILRHGSLVIFLRFNKKILDKE